MTFEDGGAIYGVVDLIYYPCQIFRKLILFEERMLGRRRVKFEIESRQFYAIFVFEYSEFILIIVMHAVTLDNFMRFFDNHILEKCMHGRREVLNIDL